MTIKEKMKVNTQRYVSRGKDKKTKKSGRKFGRK